jgi:hypothetical protein
MNFGQFRYPGEILQYRLSWGRREFTLQLEAAFARLRAELQDDEARFPGDPSQFGLAGFPSLDAALDAPAIALELIGSYLWPDLFDGFLPRVASHPTFTINSVESVEVGPMTVSIEGRGYHEV